MKTFLFTLSFACIGAIVASSANAQNAPMTVIVSKQTSQCWDVQGNSYADGAAIQMYTCTGFGNQLWIFQVTGYNQDAPLVRIVNAQSGLCVAAESANPATESIGLAQKVCNGTDPKQQWQVDQPFVQMTISSGSNSWVVHSLAETRHLQNIASHWCVRTDDTYFRPILASSCGANDDAHTRYKLSGI